MRLGLTLKEKPMTRLILAAVLLAAAPGAHAAAASRVTALEERGGKLIIHADAPPEFTVFKLSAPPRVVIDLNGGDVSAAARPMQVHKAGIASVSAAQFDEGGTRVGRIVVALEGDQKVVDQIVEVHRNRRDVLVDGLNKLGWQVAKPKGTMFVWAPIPEPFRAMGSLEFAKLCIQEAKVAVSPGIGFGEYGDHYVRFALIENEHRTRQAVRGIRRALGGSLAPRVRASAG